jgi:hypothetical protein
VTPQLLCVGLVAPGEYVAEFTYTSTSPDTVRLCVLFPLGPLLTVRQFVVPFGTSNRLLPSEQPPFLTFSPGSTETQTVPLHTAGTLVWQLGDRSAIATAGACPPLHSLSLQ